MKRFGILFVLLLSGLLAGCGTPAVSATERSLRIDRLTKQQLLMFVDDWDYFWLAERSSRLGQYHADIGH